MRRKLILRVIALLVLGGILAVVWTALDWPPPRLILKYGLPPAGGPTGRAVTIEEVKFIEVSAGYYQMGGLQPGESSGPLSEFLELLGMQSSSSGRSPARPPRWVEVERGFFIARTEVTISQYSRFRRARWRRPLRDAGNLPVTDITLSEFNSYCSWLSMRSGHLVRPPSELQWEYCCKAGENDPQLKPEGAAIKDSAWLVENADMRLHPVSTLSSNPWGISDMIGNASEWTRDCWTPTLAEYREAPMSHEQATPEIAAVRGGSYLSRRTAELSITRTPLPADTPANWIGLRPVLWHK